MTQPDRIFVLNLPGGTRGSKRGLIDRARRFITAANILVQERVDYGVLLELDALGRLTFRCDPRFGIYAAPNNTTGLRGGIGTAIIWRRGRGNWRPILKSKSSFRLHFEAKNTDGLNLPRVELLNRSTGATTAVRGVHLPTADAADEKTRRRLLDRVVDLTQLEGAHGRHWVTLGDFNKSAELAGPAFKRIKGLVIGRNGPDLVIAARDGILAGAATLVREEGVTDVITDHALVIARAFRKDAAA